jgi:hypothetical protein
MATVARIPPETPPLRSLGSVALKPRGRMPGLVGLTRWGVLSYRSGPSSSGTTAGNARQSITFYAALLSQLSEAAATGVIAHELAHAWLNEHVSPEESEAREREADRLARRWGFGRELVALDGETEPI